MNKATSGRVFEGKSIDELEEMILQLDVDNVQLREELGYLRPIARLATLLDEVMRELDEVMREMEIK